MGGECNTWYKREKHKKNCSKKPEGKRPLRRPRQKWEDNIRMHLWETVQEGVKWMHLAQDRSQWQALVYTVTTFGFHKRWKI